MTRSQRFVLWVLAVGVVTLGTLSCSGGSTGSGTGAPGSDAGNDGATGGCTPGATQCAGDAVQTCAQSRTWSTPVPCSPGTCVDSGADSGAPSAQCEGDCTPGSTQCVAGNALETCQADGTWGNAISCPLTETCVGALGGSCGGQCGPGQTDCVNNAVVTCQADGTWGSPAPCVGPDVPGRDDGRRLDTGVVPGAVRGRDERLQRAAAAVVRRDGDVA